MPLLLIPTTAGRLVRPAVACVLLLLLLVGGAPARAAGTGGIEVTPIPSEVDGKPVTSFRVEVPDGGERQVPFLLRNLEDEPRSARVFAAPVTRDGESFVLGKAGASPWVSLSDQTVMLAPGESREQSFTVNGGDLSEDVLAAVVIQVQNGAVVQRASTLIYLSPGPRVPLPVLLVLGAGALALMIGAAVVFTGRRRSSEDPATPEAR